ncbi:MAG: GNAT family N-acetyltransferase [Phycisphaera sp.]|nr:GNAT family N-acetyltransferase [Phycisphaera sp.]
MPVTDPPTPKPRRSAAGERSAGDVPELPFKLTGPDQGLLKRLAGKPAEWALRFHTLNQIYLDIWSDPNKQPGEHFVDGVLRRLGVRIDYKSRELDRIPKEGPVVVVANHPFGGIEGIALASMLRKVRPDTRVMANFLLSRIPEMRDILIFVDPFERPESVRANLQGVRQTLAHLKKGGLLAVFPAGEVSHLKWGSKAVVDPPWQASVSRLVERSGASVVPVFFDGRNSMLFQFAGLVHPRLRTAMLPRELLKRRNSTLHARIGRSIPKDKITSLGDTATLTNYLRLRTYMLQGDRHADRSNRAERFRKAKVSKPEPIVDAVYPQLLAGEVGSLGDKALLASSGELGVYIAPAQKIPGVLHEIGRLREITFRGAGEGTGKPIDLDEFDPYYLHLFVWNKERKEIVAAYRLGQTDTILPRAGKAGLYTSTLFRYKGRLLDQLNPALEMGRSFVRIEYQRSYSPLMLLWKGIGRFVVDNPRYRYLFGPVSINNDYRSISRQLIVKFLQANRTIPALSRLIQPKNPPRFRPIGDPVLRDSSRVASDIEHVSDLVAEIEADHKGVPILVKQYLRLDGMLLGFNVDPDFGQVLDGLILVDMLKTNRRVLQHYLGKEGLASFLEYHSQTEAGANA